MSVPKLAGANVLVAQIRMPIVGAWVGAVTSSADAAPSGSVLFEDGATQLRGYVIKAGSYGGRCRVSLVGGRGGLSKTVTAKPYRSIPARIVIADLLAFAGETLSTRSDAGLLDTLLPFWHREAGTVGLALSALAENALGASWRVLDDGRIWIGRDSFPEQAVKHRIDDLDEARRYALIAPDAPDLRPGVTFLNRQVIEVTHLITERIRTEVWFGS